MGGLLFEFLFFEGVGGDGADTAEGGLVLGTTGNVEQLLVEVLAVVGALWGREEQAIKLHLNINYNAEGVAVSRGDRDVRQGALT